MIKSGNGLKKSEIVCTNEIVFFSILFMPSFSKAEFCN